MARLLILCSKHVRKVLHFKNSKVWWSIPGSHISQTEYCQQLSTGMYIECNCNLPKRSVKLPNNKSKTAAVTSARAAVTLPEHLAISIGKSRIPFNLGSFMQHTAFVLTS